MPPQKGGIEPCAGCGRDTRPRNSSKEDFPDAVVRTKGQCDTCRGVKPRRDTKPSPTTTHGLELFMAGRRARAAAAARRNNPGGTA